MKLGEVAEIQLGKMLDAKKNKGTPRKYLANIDVRWGRFDLSDVKEMRFEDDEIERYALQKGDIVMCEGGEPGRCAIWQELCKGMMYQKALHRIRTFTCLDNRFAYYWFLWFGRLGGFNGLTTGATIKHLPKDKLCHLEIPLPPLPTQRRIADVLSAYDDKIANNRRRMELLEETARLLYRKMASGQLPNGTIADICREERSGVLPSDIDPKTPYIGLEHMPRRSISLCDWEDAQRVTSAKLAFKEGDILFGKIRPYFHKVGMTFVDGVASSDAVVIKPLREEFRPFVLLTVSSDAFVAAASQGMKEGSKMPRADWKQLLKYAIWVPDDNLLDGFNGQIKPILNELKTLCLQNHLLADARDLLLPRLLEWGCF